jgi:hypothetical protein
MTVKDDSSSHVAISALKTTIIAKDALENVLCALKTQFELLQTRLANWRTASLLCLDGVHADLDALADLNVRYAETHQICRSANAISLAVFLRFENSRFLVTLKFLNFECRIAVDVLGKGEQC